MRFEYRFGKKDAKFDPSTPRMKDYVSASYVPPPYAQNTWGITSWGMMINGPDPQEPAYPNGLGDCTIAACGHAVQVWTKDKITPPDSLILQKYEQWCGYVPGKPNTDQGGVESTVIKDWYNQTFGGHVLVAYVSPQPQNFGHVMHSIAEFGGIYIGLQLPNSAITQNQNGQIWDVVKKDGGVAGGHAVYCLSGDTEVSLLDGREVSIKQAQEEFKDEYFWVYSYDYEKDKLVPGRAHSVRKTKENAPVYRVTLDSGESFKATKDHSFQMLDGTWKFPEVGESLVGLYRWDCEGYERIRISKWRDTQFAHKIIASELPKPEILRRDADGVDHGGWVVHHKFNPETSDFNQRDNRPEMLEWMRWMDHQLYHSQSPERREISQQNMSRLWVDPEWRAASLLRLAENGKKATELLKAEGRCGFQVVDKSILSAQGKAIWRKSLALARTPEALETLSKTNKERYQNDPEYRAHLTKISELGGIASNLFITDCQRKARRMNGLKSCYEKWHKGKFNTFEAYLDHHRNAAETSPNHKVVSIEFAGYEDVYDLTVDDYHNFALSAGVFAHNCPAYHVKDTMAGGATTITCITWGMLQKMTRAFWEKYCDESHTLLGAAWDPAGFNAAQLKADLATVAG